MKANLIVHGIGGCGINVVNKIDEELSNFIKQYNIKVKYNLIDTSTANNVEKDNMVFNKILDLREDSYGIEGTGGERKSEIVDVLKENANIYLDKNNYKKSKVDDFHIIIFSASGGTGSVVGPLIFKELLNNNVTVIPVIIGDSSNELYLKNTINTIKTVTNIILKENKTVSVFYRDNDIHKDVDENIITYFMFVMIYLSDIVKDIDLEDMRKFFIPSNYKTIEVNKGILFTEIVNDLSLVNNNVLFLRLLLKDYTVKVKELPTVKHSKIGYLVDDSIKNKIKNDVTYFYNYGGVYKQTIDDLNFKLDNFRIKQNDEYSDLEGVDDDDLIL